MRLPQFRLTTSNMYDQSAMTLGHDRHQGDLVSVGEIERAVRGYLGVVFEPHAALGTVFTSRALAGLQ